MLEITRAREWVVNFNKDYNIYIKQKNRMKKVIRLTEAELTNLIKRVIQEQSTIKSSSKEYNMIDTCASMGTKKPVPNMAPKSGKSIK